MISVKLMMAMLLATYINLPPFLVRGDSNKTSRKRLRYGLRSSGMTLVSNKAVICKENKLMNTADSRPHLHWRFLQQFLLRLFKEIFYHIEEYKRINL